MNKNNYLIILTAPSCHFMHEPDDYFEAYNITANTEEEFENKVDIMKRKFSLKHSSILDQVSLLLTYRIK